MDKKDLQLLDLLTRNCRLTYATLADTLQLSKNSIKNRIHRLETNGTITHYNTLVNVIGLGLQKFHLLIKLRNDNQKHTILQQMAEHPRVSFANTFIGSYDVQLIIDTNNVQSYQRVLSTIITPVRQHVQHYTSLHYLCDLKQINQIPEIALSTSFDKKNDTSLSAAIKQEPLVNSTSHNYTPDATDIKLLQTLTRHPQATLLHIAKEINMHRNSVKQKIQQLIAHNIIIGFAANVSFDAFAYSAYYLMIRLRSVCDKETLRKTCKQIPTVFYAASTHGEYAIIAYVVAKNPQQLKTTIRDIERTLGDDVNSIEFMIFDELLCFRQFTEQMAQEIHQS